MMNDTEESINTAYKLTKEGRITANKYADIIDMPRPEMKHQRMDPVNRAKIFMPFDALRGYDEAIENVDERNNDEPRRDLSDEETGRLSCAVNSIKKGDAVSVTYFYPTSSDDVGRYLSIKGRVAKADISGQFFRIEKDDRSHVKIYFRDLLSLKAIPSDKMS